MRDFAGYMVLFDPDSPIRWEVHREKLVRIAANGDQVSCDRLPNGNWFEVTDACVTPDGGVVVLHGQKELSFFSAQGQPIKTMDMGIEDRGFQVCCSRRWIAVRAPSSLYMVDRSDLSTSKVRTQQSIPHPGRGHVAFSPDGSEIWWVDRVSLMRFSIP